MSSQQEPFYRITGDSGTYADPHVLSSDLLSMIERIPVGGYHYIPAQIAVAREKLVVTEVSDGTRAKLEMRLLQKEYSWYRARTGYLVQLALQQRLLARREKLLQQARDSRQAFYAFAASHPDVEVTGFGPDIPSVEEIVARIEASRAK
ncbi:MAG TPA: hypothetical protein VK497_05115 [Candidatus Saccharimonadales bacterium]|nr:hypothetical protein [Candidatus Saccharimonadales bacterium]